MADLSVFSDDFFDCIIHPVSNCFIADVKPVWRECHRVLKAGAVLLSGFNNPISYAWDFELYKQEILQVKYSIPYSDINSLTEAEREKYLEKGGPLEFGHCLEDQIGGQTEAGFVITAFYEDKWGNHHFTDKYYPHFMATKAQKF